ncbi:MAG TPA: Ig-like domain-containing protein [Candidatus Nanoarchaeia archaeon]|nr:Ig-like domain-containing protein [Candidatus Nanoarchaeia archaeon]
MQKKSQLTAFIIIGILVFAMVGAVAYFTSNRGKEYVPASMKEIKAYTDECLKKTAEDAIFLAGVQGGVIYFSDVLPNQETFYSYSTYWYDSGQDTSVSKEFIEGEISTYIYEEMEQRCIRDYESFHESLLVGEMKAKTEIKENSVLVTIDYPVTMLQGETQTMISKFSAEIPVRLGKAIETANAVVELEKKDPDNVRLSEIGDMELTVVPYRYSDDVMIYSIIDEENKVSGFDFKLVFASRFSGETSGENRAPTIVNANNLLLVQGIEAEYRFDAFDADNDNLEFDTIGRFPVSKDGVMKITPTEDDVGEYSLTVVVKDGKGGRDAETIKILVIAA